MSGIIIDPRFEDVDFTKERRFTFGDLGPGLARTLRSFAADFPLLPERQWQGAIEKIDAGGAWLESLLVEIKNQGQEGSCTSNATTAGHQCIQAKQYGKKNVIVMSAMSLYKRVARSASSGSMLSDNLDELNERGALPQNTAANKTRFEHTFPATGFSTQYPSGWEKTAKLFVSVEAFVLQSLAELVTACVNGFPIVVGRQGHSILYVRPVWRNGQVNFMYANSWDYDWGFAAGGFPGGFGLDSLGVVKQSAGWAFALRAVMSPQQASSLALAV